MHTKFEMHITLGFHPARENSNTCQASKYMALLGALYPIFLVLTRIDSHRNACLQCLISCSSVEALPCKCFTSVRRAWDPRFSAFATFLLLSSFEVCFIASNVALNMKLLQNGIIIILLSKGAL